MENKKFIELIKNGINEIYQKKWKFVFVVVYEIIAFFLWNISCALWEMLPFNQLPELIHKLIEISYFGIVATILILILFQVIIYIGKVTHIQQKNRCITGFKRCGLKTKENEIPNLYTIYKDKNKKHGLIYEFESLQIPMKTWEDKIPDMELIFKGKIYSIEYAENTDIIYVSVIPNKYATSYKIDINDNALSSMDNCLIVGQTGSRKKLLCTCNTWKNSYL